MSDITEIRNRLAECRSAIEPYSTYGELIMKMVEDFKKMEALTESPSKGNATKILQILEEIEPRIEPYGEYIPNVLANMKFVKTELKKI